MKTRKEIYYKHGLPAFDWDNETDILISRKCPLAGCAGKLENTGKKNKYICDICESSLYVMGKTKRWRLKISIAGYDIQDQITEIIEEKDYQCKACEHYYTALSECKANCKREDKEILFPFDPNGKLSIIHHGRYHSINRKHTLWGGNIPAIRENALSRYRIENKLSATDLSKRFDITHRAIQYHLAGRPFPLYRAIKVMELTGIPLIDLMITPEFIEKKGFTKEQVHGGKK